MTATKSLMAVLHVLAEYDLIDDTGHMHNCGYSNDMVCRCPALGVDIQKAIKSEASTEEQYVDKAVLIVSEMVEVGGEFFMNDEATQGWYCVRSTDPVKRDLFLPAHIFNKCFRFVSDTDRFTYPMAFCHVKETI